MNESKTVRYMQTITIYKLFFLHYYFCVFENVMPEHNITHLNRFC